jgi:hypothetical protein
VPVFACLALCAALVGIRASPAAAQEGEPPKTIVVEGQTLEVWPVEDLRRRGFEIPDIPREKNAAWVYLDAIKALKGLPPELSDAFDSAIKGTWPQGESGERLAAWLAENQPALDTARRASEMPDYYMPFFRRPGGSPGGGDMLLTALLPPLSPQRQIAKMWAAQAAYLQSQGQADAALENMLTAQRMANHVGNGKTLIEGLVGIAISSLADQGMMRIAESGQVDSQTLRNALMEMDRLSASFPSFERMIRAEEKWVTTVIDDLIEAPGAMNLFLVNFEVGQEGLVTKTGWTQLKNRLSHLYLPDRAMKANFSRHFDAVVEANRRAESGMPGPPLEEDKLFQQIPAWDTVSRMMLPSLSRAHELSLLSRSNFARTRMKLAVEAYKLEHGEYPPALTALVPEYVRTVPVDPMTGYEFEYRPTSGEKPGVAGLERVTSENIPDLVKKRRMPAILSPRASKWRRHVEAVCQKYEFTEKQRSSAEAVLREMEARAGRYEQTQGQKLAQLIEAGESPELSKRIGPLDQMFDELQKRVEALATSEQRQTVQQKDEKAKEGRRGPAQP